MKKVLASIFIIFCICLMNNNICVFNQTDKDIKELETVKDVLISAMKKENLTKLKTSITHLANN